VSTSASEHYQTALPGSAKRNGRAVAQSDLLTLAPQTKTGNPNGLPAAPSSPTKTLSYLYIAILNVGSQPPPLPTRLSRLPYSSNGSGGRFPVQL
jgi:hypothetical protein